jgi:hypothetical protein
MRNWFQTFFVQTQLVPLRLGWLLTPPVSNGWVFEDEDVIDGVPDGTSEPASPA